MTDAPPLPAGRVHSMIRSSQSQRRDLHFHIVRPSLLDLRFCGDSWIVERDDGRFGIYLGNYCLTTVEAGVLDLPSLNNLFDTMRHRRPRTLTRSVSEAGTSPRFSEAGTSPRRRLGLVYAHDPKTNFPTSTPAPNASPSARIPRTASTVALVGDNRMPGGAAKRCEADGSSFSTSKAGSACVPQAPAGAT